MNPVTQILITASLGCLVGSAIVISIELRKIAISSDRIANFAMANRMQEMLVVLSQEDRDLLRNYRRNRPAVKKERRNALEAAKQLNGVYDNTEIL